MTYAPAFAGVTKLRLTTCDLNMSPKIEKLIKQFARLPRVGNRAATRMVMGLLTDRTGAASNLADALHDASETIKPCPNCGILTDTDPLFDASRVTRHASRFCEFCRDPSRENGQLCIVRDLSDVWTLEKSGIFRGRYHIIGGLLSGATGTTPDDLNIANLPSRIAAENITEIIFALPNTVEGKTTQHFVQSQVVSRKSQVGANGIRPKNETDGGVPACAGMTNTPLQFTELASGVPLGGDLDYLDEGTLSIAFGGRKQI